ncbi:MAG: hypothetical protein KBD12_01510 [Candidatus Pacebacteria bacterium]|nr:hypothetical protein [Candidatus Paceibacterota bacterium]
MTTNQKIKKLFDLIPVGGGWSLYFFGKEFSKFLLSEKTDSQKKRFIRKIFNEISAKMNFFSLLSEIIDYKEKITADDILLSISDYTDIYSNIKDIRRNFGNILAKKCFKIITSELETDTDEDNNDLAKELKKKFPKLC